MRDDNRGFSLAEMTVAMVIFTVLILALAAVEYQLFELDRAVELDIFTNPAHGSVLARLRADVITCQGRPKTVGDWFEGPETLILTQKNDSGDTRSVIWDFSTPGIARRVVLRGSQIESEWVARGVPGFRVGPWILHGGRIAVRITGTDKEGRLVVDQIIAPRVSGA